MTKTLHLDCILRTETRRIFRLTWFLLLAVVVAYIVFDFQGQAQRLLNLLTNQILTATESSAYRQDVFGTQQEIQRLAETVATSYRTSIHISVRIDNQEVAASTAGGALVLPWTKIARAQLRSQQQVYVEAAIDGWPLVTRLAFAALASAIFLLAFALILRRRLQVSLSNSVKPLIDTIEAIDALTLTLADQVLVLPDLGNADVYEMSALQNGVRRFVSEINAHRLRLETARQKLLAAELENSRIHAIEATTQMLAHDVRRPFAILKSGMAILRHATSAEEVKDIINDLGPEIERAFASVDGLLEDVMEIGATSENLEREPASPDCLIETSLEEALRVYPGAAIALTYDLAHTHMVSVNVRKYGRVFSNIVGNAIQAMGQCGEVHFRTREKDGFIEFAICNDGSFIPKENLSRVFDAFFTAGKKTGTGLGLAIVRKVVLAHDGQIWCESQCTPELANGRVEFFFTAPIARGCLVHKSSSLPSQLAAFARSRALKAEIVGS